MIETADIVHVANVLPELIAWLVGAGLFLLVSSVSLTWFFIRKTYSYREKEIDKLFEHMHGEIKEIRDLIDSEIKAAEDSRKDTYARLERIVQEFEKKSDHIGEEIHKMDMSLAIAQDKISSLVEIQKDMRDISTRAVKLESALSSMEKIVERFGKMIFKNGS